MMTLPSFPVFLLRVMRQVLVALALMLVAVISHAAEWDIDQLMRGLAQIRSGHMVSFCQFSDAAFGRVDVHCRILGTQMGTTRYAAYAHPRCGAGVQEHLGASTLVVTALEPNSK